LSVTLLNITNAGTMSAPGVLKIRRAEGEGLTNYQGELTPISPSHFTSQPGANAMWLQVG